MGKVMDNRGPVLNSAEEVARHLTNIALADRLVMMKDTRRFTRRERHAFLDEAAYRLEVNES